MSPIRLLRRAAFLLVIGLAFAGEAIAGDCNCSRHVAACQAQGTLEGETLTLRADTDRCAQITYDINGDPDSMTIRGGTGTNQIPLLNPGRRRNLSVNSCDVCADADDGQQQTRSRLPDCAKTERGCEGTNGRWNWCRAQFQGVTVSRCGGVPPHNSEDAARNAACQSGVFNEFLACTHAP